MANRRRKSAADAEAGLRGEVSSNEKIARLLAMLLVRDVKSKTDQVPMLRSAGFEVGEVADILGISENHVKVADHLGRKKRRGR